MSTAPDSTSTLQAGQPLELEVPSDTAHLATARLFAAAVGRHFGADEEAIEDLKLGVSEAVAAAAEEGLNGGTTTIAVRPDGDSALAVEVRWGPAKRGDGADASVGTEAAIGLAVVTGLFPDAEVAERDDGWTRIGFTAPLRSSNAEGQESSG